jgi:mRNA interferase RelE/StbE
MAHRLFIRRAAEKEIADLPIQIRDRVIAAIHGLAKTPRPPGCKKLSGQHRAWRIRVGEYRVVYAVDDAEQRVEIRVVAHRKDVYR